MEKLISIIIPIYNAENTIRRALNSIIRQNRIELEILCIDDGSKDRSLIILQEIALKNPSIKIISKENTGVADTRNVGLKEATGKYIFFMDADDWICENAIKIIIQCIKKKDFDMLVFGSLYIGKTSKRKVGPSKIEYLTGDSIRRDELKLIEKEYFNAVWNKIYKKDIIENFEIRFDKELYYGEDSCFNLLYISKINKYMEIPANLYNYYVDTGTSITKKFDGKKLERLKALFLCQISILEKNDFISSEELDIKKRGLAIRYSYSAFMDLFRGENYLNKKERKTYISEGLKQFGVEFSLADNKKLTISRKILNTIICSKQNWLIYYSAYFFYLIKKFSKYKSMF